MRSVGAAGRICILGMATSAAVMALMAYRTLAYPEGDAWDALDAIGWAILTSAIAGFTISFALFVHSRYLLEKARQTEPETPVAAPLVLEPPEAEDTRAEAVLPEEHLEPDLSRLSKDERRLYDIIEEAGGSALQMNLVSSGEFSKSKVTRLLDRLESRGLIVRERSGMTNRVRLKR